ncbi:MAG: AAA family ATPase [Candidatus Promineifilaceae bacterium]|nr:AAA family ATPase [Candidatus Promineifilaceae bacterium]
MTTIAPLASHRLRYVCDPTHFKFETTAELTPSGAIIGQPRGTRAIEFGIGIDKPGYNIYALGETGTGRITAIRRFMEERAAERQQPPDWLYVHNFVESHRPRAISLPAGHGQSFQEALTTLLECLRDDLPEAFETDAYEEAVAALSDRFEEEQARLLNHVRQAAAEQGFALVETASGLSIVPVQDGQPLPSEAFQALPPEQRERLTEMGQQLEEQLDEAKEQLRRLDLTLRGELKQLNRRVADKAASPHFAHLRQLFADYPALLDYLQAMHQDVLTHLALFIKGDEAQEGGSGERRQADQRNHGQRADLRRYTVNLLVDNGSTAGAPVIVEPNPTLANLVGRLEFEVRYGALTTDFTHLQPGSLHRANGGYLVINAHDLLKEREAWEALKRAISRAEVRVQRPEAGGGGQAMANSLDPEPIPLSIKVVLLGSPSLYYALYEQEEDFWELFKVKADFDTVMPRDPEHEEEYARFVASRCHEEDLRHFDRQAVEKVIEYGSRLCGDQERLSTRFGEIADLIRESAFWAGQNERPAVTAADVRQALNERRFRVNLLERRMAEEIRDGEIFIDTAGAVVGQVNALTVIDQADHTFGLPSRITARTYMGEAGVVNIEREVDMAGPLHNKGLLTLTGYLGGKYASRQPLSLSASLTFEQNYSPIDGDSASTAELYALLSSLSDVPLKQGIAVTGSVNQLGQVQPIGGVTEKVEGFYDVCALRGLNGAQGVIIPAANVRNLMLREDIVSAVKTGQFHVWAIDNVDQGLELLTGQAAGQADAQGLYPLGTVHHTVQQRLLGLARDLKRFGDQDEEDEGEEEDE